MREWVRRPYHTCSCLACVLAECAGMRACALRLMLVIPTPCGNDGHCDTCDAHTWPGLHFHVSFSPWGLCCACIRYPLLLTRSPRPRPVQMEQEAVQKREEEEKADAMKALEHRTIDSKLEMDILDALEECKVRGDVRMRPHRPMSARASCS